MSRRWNEAPQRWMRPGRADDTASTMISYDYSRRDGIHPITWEDFGSLCRLLTERIAPQAPDLVVGVARAGLLPAATVAAGLRLDMDPVRVTRREGDRVVRDEPAWIVDVPPGVENRSVVVIDEMADTGRTLAMVAKRVAELGARRVTSAALVAHNWADPSPAAAALVTDALVVFPWDREVWQEGRWVTHPELGPGAERASG